MNTLFNLYFQTLGAKDAWVTIESGFKSTQTEQTNNFNFDGSQYDFGGSSGWRD